MHVRNPQRAHMCVCVCVLAKNQRSTSLNPPPVTWISHQSYLSLSPSSPPHPSPLSFFPQEAIVPFPIMPLSTPFVSHSYYYPPLPSDLNASLFCILGREESSSAVTAEKNMAPTFRWRSIGRLHTGFESSLSGRRILLPLTILLPTAGKV